MRIIPKIFRDNAAERREAKKATIRVLHQASAAEAEDATTEAPSLGGLDKFTARLNNRPSVDADAVFKSSVDQIAVSHFKAFPLRARVPAMRDVMAQLQKSFAPDASVDAGIDASSHVARARSAGTVKQEGQVMWLSYGTHGVLYVRSNRTNRGMPILGKIYSGFLFDRYRRPYKFKGDAQAIAQGWLKRLIASRNEVVQPHIDNVVNKASNAETPETLTDLHATAIHLHDRLKQVTTGDATLAGAAAAMEAAINARKGRRYASVDLFLRDVADVVVEAFEGDDEAMDRAHATVQDCWKDFTRANAIGSLDKREVWPIADTESWRVDIDQLWVLAADNLHFTGNPTKYDRADVSPDMKGPQGPRTKREEAAVALIGRQLLNVQRVQPQEVSHEALRRALREFHSAKMFFDERLQRNTAVDARVVATSPVMNEAQKKQALTRADGSTATVIASVPWRVTSDEASDIANKFFATYKMLPVFGGTQQEGNCNSIAAAVMRRAAQIDVEMGNNTQMVLPTGTRARVGTGHEMRLPLARVVKA